MRSFESVGLAVVIAFAMGMHAVPASAQPAKKGAQPPRPATAPAAPTTPEATPGGAVVDMMAPVPGGITSEQVGMRAMQTSYTAKAADEGVRASAEQSEQAALKFIPQVGLTARYTRLSEFTPPAFGTDAAGNPVRFPLAFDQWFLQASIVVPISDYFLRINQAATAATRAEEAARYDLITARAKSYSDGKIAYFAWLRARGAQTVAEQTLAVARAHEKDAETLFNVGNASKADVLRAQTQVAVAELGVERAKNAVAIAEKQLRIAIHASDDEKLEPGEPLDAALTPPPQNLQALISEAHQQRPEIKSVDKNAEAARKQATVARNGRWPALSAFGDATYAKPNPRYFPQVDPVTRESKWFPTWSLGAQITWSPNDFLTGGAAGAEADARAAQLDAQKTVVREGIDLETTQAYQQVLEADIAIQTTTRQLEAALEAYRVARELFNNGRGTATTMIDAEVALAQARFDNLNARVDARLARIRLDHALGRDTRVASGP